MRKEIQGPGLSRGYILDVEKGGTGKDNRQEALTYLDAIPREKLGVQNGVAGFLPNTRLIPQNMVPSSVGVTSMVNIEGPTEATLLETVDLTITNYDSFTGYTIVPTNCSVVQTGASIQVTLDVAAPEASISVNGSIFKIKLRTVNQVLPNTQELTIPTGEILAKNLRASPSGEFILVSDSTRSINSVPNSGLVGLFRRQNSTISKVGLFDHTQLPVVISYQGTGSKKINTISTTADGSTTLAGVTPIRVEAHGDITTTGAVEASGNPSYLEGLPPYRPAVFKFVGTGEALDTNPSSPTYNTNFLIRVEADGWSSEGNLINAKLFVNTGGQEDMNYVQSEFSLSGGEGAYWTGSVSNVPDGYLSPNLLASVRLEKQQVSPQIGLPEYPQGLPAYVAASAGTTVVHDITVSSTYLGSITANNIDVTFQPYNQMQLGKDMAVADNGNIAYSASGLVSGQTRRSPRVIFQLYSGFGHQMQDICPTDLGPLSTFGDRIAISPDGSVLFVADAAYDSVYMFALNTVTGRMEQKKVIRGTAGSGFGAHLSMAPRQNVLAVGIPNVGNQGSIKLYGFDNATMTLLNELKPAGAANGSNIAYMFKVVHSQLLFASNNLASTSRRVVVFRRVNGNWTTEASLVSNNAGTYTEFAQSLGCNANGTILSIAYPGSASERGSIESWMRFNGVWTFIGTKTAAAGVLGDGFGRHVFLAEDATSLIAVRTDTSKASIFI